MRPTYGSTLRTATSRTQLWSWRRVIYLNPGAPIVTCLCCTRPSTAGTLRWPFFAGERKGSGNAWRKRSRRRVQIWQSQPMVSPLPRSLPSITLVESSWQRTINGQQCSTTFGGHIRSGRGCIGCWAGRVWMPGPWGGFSWRWCRRSLFTGQICG